MKHLIAILLLLLPLVAEAQSEIYHRYASQPGLTVAQVSGFKLNDTVKVDVVMLQADNDKEWRRLAASFGISDSTGVTSWLGEVENPERRTHWNGQPVIRVIAAHSRRTIGLYHLENEAQFDALIDYQTNNMSHRHKR